MSYRVRMQPRAQWDVDAVCRDLMQTAPGRVVTWLRGFEDTLTTLAEMPRRCAKAPESRFFEEEIRQLLYREHRVLFTVAGDVVSILHVRHRSRPALRPDA